VSKPTAKIFDNIGAKNGSRSFSMWAKLVMEKKSGYGVFGNNLAWRFSAAQTRKP